MKIAHNLFKGGLFDKKEVEKYMMLYIIKIPPTHMILYLMSRNRRIILTANEILEAENYLDSYLNYDCLFDHTLLDRYHYLH
jgi:hypothetical protein